LRTTGAERRHLAREDDPEIEVARADASYVYDARGRRHIDFVSGWCVGNLGWNHPALERSAARFKGPDYVYPGHSYKPWTELARLLASIAPGKLAKCFRATGGSEAVDLAMQAAMIRTRRRRFLSLEGSYHGNTLAAMSVGSGDRSKIPNLLAGCDKIRPPLDARALERIEARLKKRDVAAFIMEPVSINLGVLVPEGGFLTQLRRLCTRYGTLLVFDEVATGFGRTGKVFATEHFDVQPDMLTLAKAVSGGLGGLGAMIATAEVASAMERDGTFYSTYGWHPRSVHVALATVRYIVGHRERLLGGVARTGAYFHDRLARFSFGADAKIRILGLAIGIETQGKYASRVKDKCLRRGLLVSAEASGLLLLPALNIERQVAAEGLDILEACVA
jgi:adenosylmethionine-8-amino-7-oxononanoate aminotransferase